MKNIVAFNIFRLPHYWTKVEVVLKVMPSWLGMVTAGPCVQWTMTIIKHFAYNPINFNELKAPRFNSL
jgi:hypothetical protein